MTSSNNLGEVFCGGATTSQHVDAEDDDHFENTTFALKRTRSIGVLDEFIPHDNDGNKIEDENSKPNEGSSLEHSDTAIGNNDNTESDASNISPTPIVLNSPDILPHDDTDLVPEPSRHVDYLSYQWDVSDISKSWRYVILKRKDVANAARLENASWRTWAQRRSNLKTISPEVVNWSKDSDVTWLYGPILKDDDCGDIDDDDHKRSTTATSKAAGDISIINKKKSEPKPILKRRTVQDMMISHSNLLKLQLATNRLNQEHEIEVKNQALKNASKSGGVPEFDDYDAISAKLNSQYNRSSTENSTSNLAEMNSKVNETKDFEPSKTVDKLETAEDHVADKADRHIHFNDKVQQCIALNYYSDDEYYEDEDDEDDYDYSDEDDYIYESQNLQNDEEEEEDSLEYKDDDDSEGDDDEGGFFLNIKSPTTPVLMPSLVPSVKSPDSKSASENRSSSSSSSSYKTIQLLPSTTLNYGSSDEESDEENPYTSSLSHNISSRGYDYYYDYNTVYTVDPNHSIYGVQSQDSAKGPDVVDVPENITLGSNFDYEIIDNEDFKQNDMPVLDPVIIRNNGPLGDNQNSHTNSQNPFQLSDSENDDDSDDSNAGLSIGAKNSSQSLAHLVFGQGENNSQLAESFGLAPKEKPVSSIVPSYSGTSLAKQPHSSNSLSSQFFNSGMTKDDESSKSLADQFFNASSSSSKDFEASPDQTMEQRKLSSTQPKSSPLPPTTTSANAFLGTTSPPVEKEKSGFIFDSDDSDDEFIEDITDDSGNSNQTRSYASLSHVADKNGIRSPSPDIRSGTQSPSSGNAIVNQAKGLANQLLNNWKNNES